MVFADGSDVKPLESMEFNHPKNPWFACKRGGEAEFTAGEGGAHPVHEQVAEAAGEHAHRQKEARWTGDPACLVRRDPTPRNNAMNMRIYGLRTVMPSRPETDQIDC